MTGYDVFVIVVLLVSLGAGWLRGGVREVVALCSFLAAAFLALILLPFTAPLGRGLVDPDWAGSVLAVAVVFIVLYFAIRIIGSALSDGALSHPQLGVLDRLLGLTVGLARAMLLIGSVHLIIAAAMPGERTPRWLGEAALYAISEGAARAIQMVAPGVGKALDAVTPVVDSSVRRGFSDEEALPQT